MNLRDEASAILEAVGFLYLTSSEIIAWADSRIETIDNPPLWLIDLSTAKSQDLAGLEAILRQASSLRRMNDCEKIMMILDAYSQGMRDLHSTLKSLGKLWIGDYEKDDSIELPDNITHILSWWDQMAFPDKLPEEEWNIWIEAVSDYREAHSEVRNHLPVLY